MSINKKITILGAGESGVGTAILAQKQGFRVFVSDFGTIQDSYKETLNKYGIQWEEGTHTFDQILDSDEVMKSPGIPDKALIVKSLHDKNIPIISELEFAARYTNAKLICITGSNGKTTTTMLTYQLFKSAGLNVGLGGNIGQSFALQVAEQNYDYYILEISSFQLDNMYNFKADIAIMTNITPDHLDRYNYEFQNYIDSKFRILQNMTADGIFIYSKDCPVTMAEIAKRTMIPLAIPFSTSEILELGGYIKEEILHVVLNNKTTFSMDTNKLVLRGKHNYANTLAATISAKSCDIKDHTIRESLQVFKGVEHRLEVIPFQVRGVTFINDSKATNVNSVWYALDSITEPIVWIVGGQDKGNDYSELVELVKSRVKAIVCMGADNSKIISFFTGIVPIIHDTHSVQDAVNRSYECAEKGDVVLLSPACASFDLFKNYMDRGKKFKEAVRNL
jgi:UDP-N-acetylmuramoylalanine--D-glutamate ligase